MNELSFQTQTTLPDATARAVDSATHATRLLKNPRLASWRPATRQTRCVAFTVLTLLTLLLSLGADAPAPAADPHQHLKQILDRPPFQAWRLREREAQGIEADENREQAWLKNLGQRVSDFFDWLFNSRASRPSPSPASSGGSALPGLLKTAMWVVIALGLVFLITLVIKSLTKPTPSTAAARVLSREQIRDALETGDALALGSAGWLGEADRLAAEQDFRAVYRALYLALLSGLHTLGKIEHSQSRTNWTYVNRYRGPAEEKQDFGDLTGVFDRVWYGRQIAAGDDLQTLRDKVAGLTQTGAAR